jgi:uncharacterized protein YggU (UPF0235/DUF167 family)
VARITIRATPRANRDEVVGWRGSQLCVRVTAAPEMGRANAAVEKTVANALGVPKSAVRVVKGHSARMKVLEVDVEDAKVVEVFGEPDPGLF